MPSYTVELTSGNPHCPRQTTVEADSPAQAIYKALEQSVVDIEDLLVDYDSETDPDRCYPGWSFIKISVAATRDGVQEHERDTPPDGYEDEPECGYNCPGWHVFNATCPEAGILGDIEKCDDCEKYAYDDDAAKVAREAGYQVFDFSDRSDCGPSFPILAYPGACLCAGCRLEREKRWKAGLSPVLKTDPRITAHHLTRPFNHLERENLAEKLELPLDDITDLMLKRERYNALGRCYDCEHEIPCMYRLEDAEGRCAFGGCPNGS